jgi:hypothetical protein
MKKLFALMLMSIGLFIASESYAQRATTIALAAGDTAVNTGTASKVIQFTAGYAGVAVTAIATEISGTSGGTIAVYGSPDGTNYDIIGSAYTVTDVASQSKTFYITAPVPVYVKVLQTGTGTMSSVLTVKYVARKYN